MKHTLRRSRCFPRTLPTVLTTTNAIHEFNLFADTDLSEHTTAKEDDDGLFICLNSQSALYHLSSEDRASLLASEVTYLTQSIRYVGWKLSFQRILADSYISIFLQVYSGFTIRGSSLLRMFCNPTHIPMFPVTRRQIRCHLAESVVLEVPFSTDFALTAPSGKKSCSCLAWQILPTVPFLLPWKILGMPFGSARRTTMPVNKYYVVSAPLPSLLLYLSESGVNQRL